MTLALAATLLASPAAAHRLKVFATRVGDSVEGRAYFVGGGAAGGVRASLQDAEGASVAAGLTGADGRFALAAPAAEGLVVVVDAEDGHVARFALPSTGAAKAGAAPPPAGAPAPAAPDAALEAAIARQIAPLAEQIDALSSAIRFRDVTGGLGYIAGIFGLLALAKARRGRP